MKAKRRQPKQPRPAQVVQAMVDACPPEAMAFARRMDRERDRYHVEADLVDNVVAICSFLDNSIGEQRSWEDIHDLKRELDNAKGNARRHRDPEIETRLASDIDALLAQLAEAIRSDTLPKLAKKPCWDEHVEAVLSACNRAMAEEDIFGDISVNTFTSEIIYQGVSYLVESKVAIDTVAAMLRAGGRPVPRPTGWKWSELKQALRSAGLDDLSDRITTRRGPSGGGFIRPR